jgi:ribosomal protein S18 acetylase RimI-like enzyme
MTAPPDITIRRAATGDEHALGAIGMATFLESFVRDIPGADLIKHCYTQHSVEAYRGFLNGDDPRYACWLAEYKATGAPIGYAVTCPPDMPVEVGAKDIELKRIYVFSSFHGSGAGKRLNDAVDTHARAMKAPRLLLGTYEENRRAIAFYAREGYAQIGTRQFQVGDKLFDDIVMGKTL